MVVQHAEIGIFDHVDVDGMVTTSLPIEDGDYAHREFVTDPTTSVEGLGGVDEVSEIPADVHGRIVVVEFERNDGHPMARTLRFPTAREIRVTRGTVAGLDHDDRQLTIANDEGLTQIELGVGYGAVIDDNIEGLIPLDDLQYGQSVAVYYAERAGDAVAYLIMRAG